MKTVFERLHNGIIKENPTFVLMLGMCPTLAVTSSAVNGLGMGLAVKESSVHLAPRPAVSLFDKTEKPVIVSLSVDMPTAVLISPP